MTGSGDKMGGCKGCNRSYGCALRHPFLINCPCMDCLVKAMCSNVCKERQMYYKYIYDMIHPNGDKDD